MTEATTIEPPARWVVSLVVGAIAVLVVIGYVADATWPTLVEDHPLLLVAMKPLNRYLIATSNQLDAFSYYTVGAARLLLSDPLFYLLGMWYGDRAIEWVRTKAPTYGTLLDGAQRGFTKAAYLLVFIAPNNWICLFAGASRLPWKLFFAVNVAGTFARLYLIRVLGDAFSSPIDNALDFVGRYRWQFVVASVVLVAITIGREVRSGDSEVGLLRDLERETGSDPE